MCKKRLFSMIGATTILATGLVGGGLNTKQLKVEAATKTGLVQLWQVVPDGQTSKEGVSASEITSALQCMPNHKLYPMGSDEHPTYVNSCYVDDALYLGEDNDYYYIYVSGYEGKVPKEETQNFKLDLNNDGKKVSYEIKTVAYFIPDGGSAYSISEEDETEDAKWLLSSTDTLDKTVTIEGESEEGISTYSTRESLGSVKSPSYYANENGTLIHYLTNNVRSTTYSKTTVGKAPSWMKESTKYYSYDGIYFYSDWRNIQVSGKGAVNEKNPFYNYYQYLPFRTSTNYTISDINSFTKSYGYTSIPTSYPAGSNQSMLVNAGKYFISAQDTYGINGLLQYAMGIHESGWGRSSLSINKNNLFGMNAVDSNPYGSGTSFSSVQNGINYHADRYVSWGYTDPLSDARYYGSHVGNKGSGMNVKYASDPFWGEKIAGWYYRIDKYLGMKDYDYYSIGIKTTTDNYNVRNAATTSSSVYYQTKNGFSNYRIKNYPFVITGEKDDFYQIKSDTPIVNGVAKFDGGYTWKNTFAYVSKDAVDVINNKNYKGPGSVGGSSGSSSSGNDKPTESNKSSNANLSSLTTSVGTLNPTFSPSTTSYTLTVPGGTKYINFNANLEDAKAKIVSGTGKQTVDPDASSTTIKLQTKAENGTSKTYTITVKHESKHYGVSRISGLSFTNNRLQVTGYSYVRAINVPNTTDLVKKLKFTDINTNKQVKTYVLPNVYNTSLSRDTNHGNGVYNYDWAKFDTKLDISDLPVGEYVLKIYTKAGNQKFDVVIPYHSSFKNFSFTLNGKKYEFVTDRWDNSPSIRIIVTKK